MESIHIKASTQALRVKLKFSILPLFLDCLFKLGSYADEFIPVRLDMEFEGRRFKENIFWNVEEPFLTPESFAKILAEENNLPLSFENEIAMYFNRLFTLILFNIN